MLIRFVTAAGLLLALTARVALADAPPAEINYDRQIRPILSNNCFKCHGPDAEQRESGLRLDLRDEALKPADSGKRAIVPGKPQASRLIERIFSTDGGEVMPPPDSNKKLTGAEKDLLRQWIAQGAKYADHWSFVVPARPVTPDVKNASWPKNEIDRFVLARLEAAGLAPAPEADKTTLIRRATLDLTGLPPTLGEIDAFLADNSADAYEKLIDRLLQSPHHGERLALDWLDAARYADTHGYHIDSGRDMTRWREWVIDSFQRNKPFDEFTIEQLAGDLLPDATLDQKVASGFNRNHMINFEGGAIPEEYHTAYIIDRVNTTGAVWLGLTVGCAQCHDHKYDPITQRDFYRLFAFFYNVPENGLDGTTGNAAPMIRLPDTDQQQRLDELATEIPRIEGQLAAPWPEIDVAQAAWESSSSTPDARENAVEWTVLDPGEFRSQGGAALKKLEDKSLLASGANPGVETYTVIAATDGKGVTALRLEVLPDASFPANGPGRSVNGNLVLTNVKLAVAPASESASAARPVRFKAASADFSQDQFAVENAIDTDPQTGWGVHPEVGKPHSAVFEFEHSLAGDAKSVLSITLEFQSLFRQHQCGKFRLSITSAKDPHAGRKLPEKIARILTLGPEKRDDSQRAELRTYFRTQVTPEGRRLAEQLAVLRQSRSELEALIPTAMVMQEMATPRDTFMLIRGQYDKKGDKVAPGVPEHIAPYPESAPPNRLGLAQWLVGPSQPLTARVIVNRYWQMFFGTGLVKTAEDFGSQGELPSHPDLLDWLATEFTAPSVPPLRKGGAGGVTSPAEVRKTDSPAPPSPPLPREGEFRAWNVRALLRLIVTSATYRQSSAATPELNAKDPENRLVARGPRFRLQAEFIRDQALAVSGLLNPKIGGRSVSPYQPAGLWEELMSRADGARWTAQTYVQSHGADLYRRTMYTFWKRTCPPPTLATFDAPDRETCTVRRARTNTPLQALILLNDPTYVEASRKLAERILSEGGRSAEEKITFAFRLATARQPAAREMAVLRKVLDRQLAACANDREAALKLLSVGESPRNENLDVVDLAAWTTVAGVILNLDETVTKG
jgi:hypothetical protein